jgi:hypothetical protein
VSATTSAIVLYGLLSADADLGLLLRGKHKPDAFRGKVIWVTGASQVCTAVVHYLLRIAGRRYTNTRPHTSLTRAKAQATAALQQRQRHNDGCGRGAGGIALAPSTAAAASVTRQCLGGRCTQIPAGKRQWSNMSCPAPARSSSSSI